MSKFTLCFVLLLACLLPVSSAIAANACDRGLDCYEKCEAKYKNSEDRCILEREGCLAECNNYCDPATKASCDNDCFDDEKECAEDAGRDLDDCLYACSLKE
ncbi:MAG: hypothetical protein J5J00_06580 [Deltaproteobacteria bacterium]|nr:hypothetical protein [Deltaproteobacteria bacterium]